MPHRYLETHPWINFEYAARLDQTAMRLGEAFSKCQHLSGTPLQPGLATDLASFYMIKGVNATTAIEGNTLSEDEVRDVLDGVRRLPPSQEYLQQEVENVRDVLQRIHDDAFARVEFRITPEWLKTQNRDILAGIDCEDHVVPGEYTKTSLIVGSVYRGAPPADVPYLVERLCDWLNSILGVTAEQPPEVRFVNAFTAAVLGHLYIAWIHPFGDGNGRTARALECAVLANSGQVPWVSANLLSNHYNRTRSRYYQRLEAASRERDVHGFISYAAAGFVDMLREQIRDVQQMQRRVAWVNFVHEAFQRESHGDASHRRRALVLALPDAVYTQRAKLRRLTPELAEMYAGRGEKTVSHDLNALRRLGLVELAGRAGARPLTRRMDAFMPINHHV